MPDLKISALPAATPLTGSELMEVVQAGGNDQTTVDAIVSLRLNPSNAQVFVDDFLFGSNETGEVGELNWSFTNGTVAQAPSSVAGDHPGTILRASSATASQIAAFHSANVGTNAAATLAFSDFDEMTWVLRPVSNATDFTFQIGLGNQWTTAVTQGAYFEKLTTDTNWFAVTQDSGGTKGRTDTGVTFTPVWIKLKIRRISASVWGFTVNNGTEIVRNNVNPPTETVASQPGFQITPTTTTIRQVYVDFFSMKTRAIAR